MTRQTHFVWRGLVLALFIISALPTPVSAQTAPTGNWDYPVKISDSCYITGNYYQDYSHLGVSSETYHTGIDIGCTTANEPILAVDNGQVILVEYGWLGYWGYDVFVNHGQDRDGHPVNSFYAHLNSVLVNQGDSVTKGQQIGVMGATKGGTHLHWGRSNIAPNEFPTYEYHAEDHNGLGWLDPLGNLNQASTGPTFLIGIPEGFSYTPDIVQPNQAFVTGQKLWNFRYPLAVFLSLFGLVVICLFLTSKEFRSLAVSLVFVLALLTGGLYFLSRTFLNSSNTAPRDNFSYTVNASAISYQPPSNQQSPTTCSLPSSYPESIRHWCNWIEKYAGEAGIDPQLIAATMLQESVGDPLAYSSSGAVGLMQVMPNDGIAASFINRDTGVPYFWNRPSIVELQDPEYNIQYGIGMLAGLGAASNPESALYHYGPADDPDTTVNERQAYVDIIMTIYRNYR